MRYFNLEDYLQTLNDEGNSYWSGLNARVFINGIYVSEAIQFEYQVNESVVPTFHYSEYVSHTFLAGSRIIAGRFSINTTNLNYIHYLIKELKSPTQTVSGIESGVPNSPPDIDVPVSGSNSFSSAVDLFNYVKTFDKNQIIVKPTSVVSSSDRPLYQFPPGVEIILALGNFEVLNAKVLKPLDNEDDYLMTNALFDSTAAPVRTAHSFINATVTGRSQVVGDDGKSLIEVFDFMATDVRLL